MDRVRSATPDSKIVASEVSAARNCACCGLPILNTKDQWDLRLPKATKAKIGDLEVAAHEGCPDCSLIFDALITYIPDENLNRRWGITIHSKLESDRRRISEPHSLTSGGWDLRRTPLLSENTSSKETLRIISDWTTDCVTNHKRCRKSSTSTLPKRILCISKDRVHLQENHDNLAPYACVSHCWGPEGVPYQLTHATMDCLKGGCLIEALPKTFQDSVHVCQQLGITYIWIDALCIMQDSLEDWKEAAATMADVYEYAHITIAATYSPDSNGGLFSSHRLHVKRLSKHPDLCVRETLQFPTHCYEPIHKLKKFWPLLSRAWVYQERRLSPRIVHFGQNQVYWECKHHFASEDGIENQEWTRKSQYTVGYWSTNQTCNWHKTVAHYFDLQLTFESDRLPAIAALAQRASQKRRADDVYMAGMWKHSILSDMCWIHFASDELKPRPNRSVPTWSWASVQCCELDQGDKIVWEKARLLDKIKVMKLNYTARGLAHLGEVDNASIVLKAPVIMLTREGGLSLQDVDKNGPKINAIKSFESWHGQPHFRIILQLIRLDYDLATAEPPIEEGTVIKFMILQLGEYVMHGLALRLHPELNGAYERIGWISTSQPKDMKDRRQEWKDAKRDLNWYEDAPTYDEFFDSLPWEELKIV